MIRSKPVRIQIARWHRALRRDRVGDTASRRMAVAVAAQLRPGETPTLWMNGAAPHGRAALAAGAAAAHGLTVMTVHDVIQCPLSGLSRTLLK